MKGASLNWLFATNVGGQDAGLNNSGIETFRGNFYRYLARELIQNSMDARFDPVKPVEVHFSLENLKPADLPDSKALILALQRCAEFWEGNRKAEAFFQKATASLNGAAVPCLRVSDYNTKGVSGSDTDRHGNWYNLVRCVGASNKGGGEGGSFGIGKNAPFAASNARTVFYSTRLRDSSAAFQGVAQLATHADSNGERLQATGFLGTRGGAAVRNVDDIPDIFRRNDQGTDIWIVAYAYRGDWREDLIFSVLDSFWPAIKFGDLVVKVDQFVIDSSTLEGYLKQYSTQDGFTGHLYYEAFVSPKVTEPVELPTLGECTVYVRSAETPLPKRVAMIRKAGMVVTTWRFNAAFPFAGVFICTSDKGNEKLREMEPPRHDEWNPDLPDPGANRKTYNAVREAVKVILRGLNPMSETQALAIPGLEKYLPDVDPDRNNATRNGSSQGGAETEKGIVQPAKPARVTTVRNRPPAQTTLTEALDVGDPVAEEEQGDAVTGGENDGTRSPGGKRNSRGGEGDLARGDQQGRRQITSTMVPSRSFAVDARNGRYLAHLSPASDLVGAFLVVVALGEDQKSALRVRAARTASGASLRVEEGRVGPVDLRKGERLSLEFQLDDPALYAVEIYASEVS